MRERTVPVREEELKRLRFYAQWHDSQDALKLIDEILARKPQEAQRIWNNWQVGHAAD